MVTVPELSPLGNVKATAAAGQLRLDVDVADPALREGLGVAAPPPALPAGFAFPTPVTLIRERDGSRNAVVDTSWLPGGLTVYTAPWAPSSGAGWANAPVRLREALATPGVKRVVCAPGVYDRNAIPSSGSLPAASIVCPGGVAVFSTHETPASLAWTVNTPMVSTWKATRSLVVAVRDESIRTPYGVSVPFTQRASAADVDANPGSWCLDAGVLYVRTLDARKPDENIRVYLGVSALRFDGGDLHLEGIEFHGGGLSGAFFLNGGVTPIRVSAQRCAFRYSPSGNGLTAWGTDLIVLRECEASDNYLDGFNYGTASGVTTNAMEVSCVATNNGFSGSGNDNASTSHNGARVIRVAGEYEGAQGRNVVDVHDGTKSFNWGCAARASRGSAGNNVDWEAGQPTLVQDVEMWLVECSASGSTAAAVAQAGTKIYHRDNVGIAVSGPGAAIPYA